MKNRIGSIVTAAIVAWTLLFSTLAFGQIPGRTDLVKTELQAVDNTEYSAYLIEVPVTSVTNESYGREAKAITQVLTNKENKNAVLIDDHGYVRDMVASDVAARLAGSGSKRLYRINWNALFGAVKDEAAMERTIAGVLRYIESTRDRVAIYLDDIATFSTDAPMLGQKVAANLYTALSQGRMQVVTASDMSGFNSQIAGDSKLKSRFERIAFASPADEDPFVGDKLSPDLREMLNGVDKDASVKVILQSDDIRNPQLLDVLKKNNVNITARAEGMNMLMVYIN
jgi:hypothetical protein